MATVNAQKPAGPAKVHALDELIMGVSQAVKQLNPPCTLIQLCFLRSGYSQHKERLGAYGYMPGH